MHKHKVLHIGGLHNSRPDEVWGGTRATNKYLSLAFKDDLEFDINFVDRRTLRRGNTWDLLKIKKLISEAEIVHLDDSGLCNFIYENNLRVDVIGPITRSPKTVKAYGANWNPAYTEEWFYSHKIIRLNINEEKNSKYVKDIYIIDHGVPASSTLLLPKPTSERKYILWAGDKNRFAKNFELMQEIMLITDLPSNYKFRILSKYKVGDYWRALDEAAIVVNTSRYESFCCAMFEAKAKGVPVVYKENLHNGRFLDNRLQVEYNAKAYRTVLLGLLADKNALLKESELSRKYVLSNASLDHMRKSWAKVYREILEER